MQRMALVDCYLASLTNPRADSRPNTNLEDAADIARLTNELVRPARPCRDQAYWNETASLVMEYFELKAGASYNETLHEGFVTWLKGSPAHRRQYLEGDDMRRAALVDWYLKVVR